VLIDIPRPGIAYPVEYAVINNPLDLKARTFGASVLWKPPIYLDKTTILNPVFNSPLYDEAFLYRIEITTATGCLTVDTQIVKTIKEVKIYVPNGFTPNSDGRNDFLRPVMYGVKELQYFRIYNRWGQLIYDMKPGQQGWNGIISGQLQTTAVFVWVVQGLGLDKKIYRYKGTSVLIR
jgi:gliding motility-associated-like protein